MTFHLRGLLAAPAVVALLVLAAGCSKDDAATPTTTTTEISEQDTLYATVPRLTGTTPAQRFGDLPALLLAAAALLLLGRPRWRRMRDLQRSVDHGE